MIGKCATSNKDYIEKSWELYEELPEIIVLVPALLGLKGNLEMTLASRLSTQVKHSPKHKSLKLFHK